MNELDRFRSEVEQYLAAEGLTPTSFGSKAVGDPNFVFNLREGRQPRFSTIEKVREFMSHSSPVSRETAEAAA